MTDEPARQLVRPPVRRLVTAPAVILVTVLIGFTFPLWLVAAAALSPLLPGRWRPLRVLWVAILYLVCESVLLVILFGLWVSSGLGGRIRTPYFEGIHYDLVQGLLWIFFRESAAGAQPDHRDRRTDAGRLSRQPLLVCCRHGGPGDSFMLIYALMHWYDREPRVVLKDTLAWDPAIDVLLHRIPARFISPNPAAGERVEEPDHRARHGLDENDAFVIFPEGGNFTPRRRERAIERLHKLGMHRMADRAEAMTNVLAPRPGGFLAALEAAPDADVLMVAHTGTDHLLTVGDVWRELPMDKRLLMRWWQVPRDEIPRGPRRPDRVAVRLVGADRRVDQREPSGGSARPQAPRPHHRLITTIAACRAKTPSSTCVPRSLDRA